MYGNSRDNNYDLECHALRGGALAYERFKAKDEILRLRSELAAERARIDFLERTGTRHVYAIFGSWLLRRTEDSKPERHTSLRAAIDAAMAASGGESDAGREGK